MREFLASYLHLALLTDHTELPRQPSDNSCLFSVVFGQLTALVGDPGDPALAAIRDHAGAGLKAGPEKLGRERHRMWALPPSQSVC